MPLTDKITEIAHTMGTFFWIAIIKTLFMFTKLPFDQRYNQVILLFEGQIRILFLFRKIYGSFWSQLSDHDPKILNLDLLRYKSIYEKNTDPHPDQIHLKKTQSVMTHMNHDWWNYSPYYISFLFLNSDDKKSYWKVFQ